MPRSKGPQAAQLLSDGVGIAVFASLLKKPRPHLLPRTSWGQLSSSNPSRGSLLSFILHILALSKKASPRRSLHRRPMTISRERQAGIKPNPAGSLGGRSMDRHRLVALSLAAQLTPPSTPPPPPRGGCCNPTSRCPASMALFLLFWVGEL